MRLPTFGLLLSLFAALPILGTAQTPAADAALFAQLKEYRYGGNTAVLDAVSRQVAESRSDPARRRQLAQELADVLRSDAPFEVRQFACRQLIPIATEAQVPALAGVLPDEQLAHYALMALARIPGKAIDDALLQSLPQSRGKVPLEILDTLADRGDLRAVPPCLDRLNVTDPTVRESAASALAKLADQRSVQALRQSYARSSGAAQTSIGYALLACAHHLQTRGDLTTASSLYDLMNQQTAGPMLRAAALRGLVQVRGEKALPLLLQALDEDGTPRQSMAAGLARDLPGPHATRLLSAALPKRTTRGQVLLLAALSDRGDPTAAPAVMALCHTANSDVRVAAIRALGALGDATSVDLLITTAARGAEPERVAARDSLAQLRGEAVDKALLKEGFMLSMPGGTLANPHPWMQEEIEAIQSLGRRKVTEAISWLMEEAGSNKRPVSAAALRVLQDLGRPADLPKLVDLLLTTPPDARGPVTDAISEIARRGGEEGGSAALLLQRLSAASKPADKVALLTLLGQVGGPGTMDALQKALTDPNAEVQATALSMLAEWPTDEPKDALLHLARTSQDERQRTIALRGYLRMIGADEQQAPDQALARLREAAPLVTHSEEKRLLLAGLAKVRSLEALDYAAGFLKDNEVHAEAELAVVELGQSTVGADRETTRTLLEPIARSSDNEEVRKRAQEVLARIPKFGDFITAWEVSPVYQREGVDYSHLFDMPFPPEEPGHEKEVPWRLMPAGTNPEQPWLLDLLALWGGEQRVAYLRTGVWSSTDRDLVLQMGSDDGLKVWWNGQVVLADNVARAVAPAQEKVTVKVHAGWNTLLLKVTQNNQGWGACARFTNPDGSPATSLRFGIHD